MDNETASTAAILGLAVIAIFAMGLSVVAAIKRRSDGAPSDDQPIQWTSGRCLYCSLPATRYVPSILERRGLAHALAVVLPIGLVPPRYRRGYRFQPKCSLCDYHCAIAERAIDTFLMREQLTLAEYLYDRSRRVDSFCSKELDSILVSTSKDQLEPMLLSTGERQIGEAK